MKTWKLALATLLLIASVWAPARPATADPAPAQTCGACSDPVCVDQPLNSRCNGVIRHCQQVSLCSTTVAPVPLCECLPPP
jgi:hypothetical protein